MIDVIMSCELKSNEVGDEVMTTNPAACIKPMNVRYQKSFLLSEETKPPRSTTVDHKSAKETTNFSAFSI